MSRTIRDRCENNGIIIDMEAYFGDGSADDPSQISVKSITISDPAVFGAWLKDKVLEEGIPPGPIAKEMLAAQEEWESY